MATCMKSAHLIVFVILVIVASGISISDAANELSPCICYHTNAKFDETIKAEVYNQCRKCFKFTYDFTMNQNWTARVCVNSPKASHHNPVLVVVREHFSVLSFSVPQIPENGGKNRSFTNVCHTLCPLANYFDDKLNGTEQNIYVEISSQNANPVQFTVTLSVLKNFIIEMDQPLTVNITPTQAQVMQYDMKEDINSVTVEATSSDSSCMVLGIQDIKCPFSDFESTLPDYSAFYQTLMTKSAITISREFFPMGRVYVVLILKATNEECRECCETDENLSKEVTVRIVPPISNTKFYWGIAGPVLFYLLVFYFTAVCYYYCCRRTNLPYSCCVGEQVEVEAGEDGDAYVAHDDAVPLNNVNGESEEGSPVDTRNVCYLAILCMEGEVELIRRSKLYTWNLGTIAIFYLLPVFQLVYLNQAITNLTGNQDLCYYNFLCSHRLWVFSDFNHVWSNIGYIMLGILFLYIVWKRESEHSARMKNRQQIAGIGIFGLYYAMGLSLLMEGFLSACYHVCPSQTNFQFDTTFMYVLCVLSILKLYQCRHPDTTVQSHAAWMILASLIILSFIGGQNDPICYLLILVLVDIGHLIVVYCVIFKIYFLKTRNRNMGMIEIIKRDWNNPNETFKKHNRARLILLLLAGVLNIAMVIGTGVKQESVPMCILIYLIVNLFYYILYYMVMKIVNKEGIPWYSLVYTMLSLIFWIIAYINFDRKRSQWELTPAESRERNVNCISGPFLDFYDEHDVWHFCSSIAIFLSYLVPFTMDDNLEETDRNRIIVF